jgi:hypothetical protein
LTSAPKTTDVDPSPAALSVLAGVAATPENVLATTTTAAVTTTTSVAATVATTIVAVPTEPMFAITTTSYPSTVTLLPAAPVSDQVPTLFSKMVKSKRGTIKVHLKRNNNQPGQVDGQSDSEQPPSKKQHTGNVNGANNDDTLEH